MNTNTITIIVALVSGAIGAAGGVSYVKLSSPVAVVTEVEASAAAEETHDVAWFEAHTAERKAKITECKGNPGELEWIPNCRNAGVAQGHADLVAWGKKG
jgi:hypothetical protein